MRCRRDAKQLDRRHPQSGPRSVHGDLGHGSPLAVRNDTRHRLLKLLQSGQTVGRRIDRATQERPRLISSQIDSQGHGEIV
jgi:hypothetical protein